MASAQKGDSPEWKAEHERWRVKAAPWVKGMEREDADRILDFLAAINPDDYTTQPGDIGTKSYSTIAAYGQNLRLLAKAAPAPLVDLTARQLNDVFSDMEVSKNTVGQRQAAARVFYRYHNDLGVDPELITIERPERSPVEPRDLFTRDEVDAMHAAIDNERDRAMIDLMLYTGQRIRAIQTLKVGDIDLENGRFYLNTEEAGLKGAKGMRPMTLARDSCASWMDNHPAADDPDAYFITKLPDAAKGDTHIQLHQSTINRRIEAVARKAGIDRVDERGHAHNFRHTFVRWAYIYKDMDIPSIKYMTGHSKDSQTLERTYMNIFETDFANKVEAATGTGSGKETDDDDPLSPEVCPICDYAPLPQDARACPRCTNLLSPDAAMARGPIKQAIHDAKDETDDIEEYKRLDALERKIEANPELIDLKKLDQIVDV